MRSKRKVHKVAQLKYPQGIIAAAKEARTILEGFSEIQIQEVQLYMKERNHLVSLWYDESVPEFDLGHDLSELKRDWLSAIAEDEIMEEAEFYKILDALDTMQTFSACAVS